MTPKRTLTYRIVLKEEPEGGYTVSVPTLPGCITYGENHEEAFKMAKEAITAYLESQSQHGESIVDDSQTFEGVLNLEYA
ncbi:MAG: type II toxin-antitoxin system HicB family antitoxin [Chloroflexi bacterium]|nr:type II toxin-antitoxin system HicB family antitoxin [Chloroflexota bacterium]